MTEMDVFQNNTEKQEKQEEYIIEAIIHQENIDQQGREVNEELKNQNKALDKLDLDTDSAMKKLVETKKKQNSQQKHTSEWKLYIIQCVQVLQMFSLLNM